MFIYVIGPVDGAQKIGISGDPHARCRTLQRDSSGELHCWHTVKVPKDRARTVELYAHSLLAKARAHGEWFDVSLDDAIAVVNFAAVAVLTSGATKERKTMLVAAHFCPGVGDALRQIALEEKTTVKALFIEGVNMLFAERGIPPIARDPLL